jgi:hypothetical protein
MVDVARLIGGAGADPHRRRFAGGRRAWATAVASSLIGPASAVSAWQVAVLL